MIKKISFLPGEYWWGGSTNDGFLNPFAATSCYKADFRRMALNQTMPLFISSKGRFIWSDEPFAVEIKNGEFTIEGDGIELWENGKNLREAYMAAMKRHFPFEGQYPPEEFFKTAQYNTWIEFMYYPDQEKVLKYAKSIIDNGFEPGIFIIDEGWHTRYGTWEFDFARFPDPRKMVDDLHKMGFTVMLWVVPVMCSDGEVFTRLCGENSDMFLRNEEGNTAIVKWWNGYSAILDFTKEADCDYLDSRLHYLMDAYGVDGFKFDGGNLDMYHPENVLNGTMPPDYSPAKQNMAWNDFGAKYRFHEFKDTFKGGGKPVIQRLSDKNHSWNNNGINALIPNSLLQGLIGHPFICPDMIGGGEYIDFTKPEFKADTELLIRMAQCCALFPMIQFSLSPWNVLNEEELQLVREAAKLRSKYADKIISLVKEAAQTGEPVIRHMEYQFPGCGYEKVCDQFMLGSDLLVAPVIRKGAEERSVMLPEGLWRDEEGKEYRGGKEIIIDAPISRLPRFLKII